jgi:hypothetical protein
MTRLIRLCLIASALALPALADGQERFGTLTGQVVDAQSAAVPGVAVTVTSADNGEVRTYVTDASGKYVAPDLPPGRYTVEFQLAGFQAVKHTDVSVVLGRSFTLDATLAVSTVAEAVQVIGERAPLVDTHSTLIAHNVSAEEFDRMPKTRTFQSIALSAPSVNSGEIEGGLQVNGASGAENAFTVDGVVTNSLINGQSRENTVFEYLQEVQVKTSGISAEYGGALGGVISAVTKSGGNTRHGELHYYGEGSALSAKPVKRLVLDPITEQTTSYVQDAKDGSLQQEIGGSIGGPIIRNRLFYFASYSPRFESTTRDYVFTDEPGRMDRDITRQQLFGKVTYTRPGLSINGSGLWTPTKADGTLPAFDGAVPGGLNTSKTSQLANIGRGYDINQVNATGSADITLGSNAFLSVRGAVFNDRYSDTGIPLVTPYTYGNPTTAIDDLLPPDLRGPIGTTNTPRAEITDFDTTRRGAFNVDYNQIFRAGGYHTFKAGYGFQRTVNDINSYYPGGYVNIFWDSSFTFGGQTGTGTYGYYEVNDRRIANKAGNNIHSLYAQDQWAIGTHLTLDIGLRAEDEKVPTFRPDYLKYAFQFSFADKLAPRLGAAWDVKGDGRIKVFGSWGLYYDWTKYELVRGSFGAETWCIYYRGLDTLDLGSLNLDNMPGPDLWVTPGTCRDRRVPSFGGDIDPDIEPMKQASVSSGAEFQVGRNGMVSVHYIHNDLLETIEDIGYLNAQGDEGYVIGNPGKRVTALQFPTGATPTGFPTPRPARTYDALELGYNRRFSGGWFFSANYTLSRLYGNYAGLASSDEITTPTTGGGSAVAQQQSSQIARPGGNVNRYWDLDELLWDSHGDLDPQGRLATDRPHVVKLYGSYDLPYHFQVGAFFYGGSGTPISTYVTSTNSADLFVNGRGDMGRTPALTQTDLMVSHTTRLRGGQSVRLELTVLNLFNQKTARHIFNYLNKGAIVPDRSSSFIDLSDTDLSQGYDYNALILATPDGANAYDPRYGMADLFNPGTHAYATVKYQF